jgi:hypothetical protein
MNDSTNVMCVGTEINTKLLNLIYITVRHLNLSFISKLHIKSSILANQMMSHWAETC